MSMQCDPMYNVHTYLAINPTLDVDSPTLNYLTDGFHLN